MFEKKPRIQVTKLTLLLPLLLLGIGGLGLGSQAAEGRLPTAKIAPLFLQDLEARWESNHETRIPVIVQVAPESFRENGTNALSLVKGYRAALRPDEIASLLESDAVEFVSPDTPLRVTSTNPFTGTLGLQQSYGANKVSNLIGYDGAGVTVAVFDSGLAGHADLNGYDRVVEFVDFTSGLPVLGGNSRDPHGHGTHVTGIIGGKGFKSKGDYAGVARKTDFVVLRVVGDDGTGLTSNLIAAIQWVIDNKEVYGIRVANLSLGAPPLQSHTVDPLCQAVAQMVEAGIVTVVSAGNLGKTEDHPEIWGGITNPGIEPTAITVGAINTKGTLTHADDVATSYSSRGPTIDGIFKPDLVAPGNQIHSLSDGDNNILENYPELEINRYYMHLSGSSMATAFVTGTVALMLEANPALTPRLVKAILLITAIKLDQAHFFEQGNGLLNTYLAVRLAEELNVSAQALNTNVPPVWNQFGEMVWAGGAIAVADQLLYTDLVTDPTDTPIWGSGLDWDALLHWSNSVHWADGLFAPDSVIWADGTVVDGVVWTDSTFWTQSLLWSSSFMWSDSFIWSDAVFWTNGTVWADSLLWSGSSLWSDLAAQSNPKTRDGAPRDSEENSRFLFPETDTRWIESLGRSGATLWSDAILWSDTVSRGDSFLTGDSP